MPRCSAAGSAPALGAGCRRFKSCHLDQSKRAAWVLKIQCSCGFSLLFCCATFWQGTCSFVNICCLKIEFEWTYGHKAVHCVAGKPADGFGHNQVNFPTERVLNRLVKAGAVFSRGTRMPFIGIQPRELPVSPSHDVFFITFPCASTLHFYHTTPKGRGAKPVGTTLARLCQTGHPDC